MKTIEVVAAIIHHDGKILATQRGYGDFKDGWEFPGGKMEAGETAEHAIVREIEEELQCGDPTRKASPHRRIRLSELPFDDALLHLGNHERNHRAD